MGEVLSHRELSELIGTIYDCAIDPGQWETTLARIGDTFACAVVSLTLNDLRKNRFLLNKAAGWEPQLLRLKSERHVAEINARLTEWLAEQSSMDEMFVTSLHLSPEYIGNSLYVEECLKPQGIVDIMHMFLMSTHKQFAEIGLGRHARQGAITEREMQLGRLLLPHLRKAVTISGILDAQALEHARMAEALNGLRCGVVFTDEHGRILHANRSAERMMRRGKPIGDAHGVLVAQTPSASRQLRNAIRLAVQGFGIPQEGGAAVRLSDEDEQLCFAHVLPMTESDLRARLQPDAVAAVFIAEPDDRSGVDLVTRAFNLTTAEARVLESLIIGHTLAETALHLNVAPSTAKTHLDHIFAKTGVSRQADLIRLVMQAAQPLRQGAGTIEIALNDVKD